MILLSNGGQAVFQGTVPDSLMLVATVDGVYRFERTASGSWALAQRSLQGYPSAL